MKGIHARTRLRLVLSFSWFIVFVMGRQADAGDYYIYQDANGKLIISNNVPPKGSNIIKRETLAEVTNQQILESQARENQLALDNRLSSLERSVGELTENLRAQSEVLTNVPEGYGDTNIAVGVTQAPLIVTKPVHRKFSRPANLRHNLPSAQPRFSAPAARCCGGGRAG